MFKWHIASLLGEYLLFAQVVKPYQAKEISKQSYRL